MANYNQINLMDDKRVGPRGVPPIQRNAATQGYKTSDRPAATPLQKSINPITSMPDLGDAMNFSKLNEMNYLANRPRPLQDPSALGSNLPQINARPINSAYPVQGMPPSIIRGEGDFMGSGAPPTRANMAYNSNLPGRPNPNAVGPAMGTGNPYQSPANTYTEGNRLGEHHSVFADEYNYNAPGADPRVGSIYDGLMNRPDINVLNPNAPQVGNYFDPALNNLRNSPNVASDVAGNISRFSSGIDITGGNTGGGTRPDRNAGFFDMAGKMVGAAQPGAPGRTNPTGQFGNIDLNDSDTQRAATARELSLSDTLAANAGLLTDEQINKYLKPFEDRAKRIGDETFAKQSGYFNKIGAGGNVDAFNNLSADIAARRMEDVGGRFSEILKQSLAQRPEMLKAAADTAGNVSGREANTGIARGQIKLGQRGQDISAATDNRQLDVTERGQDISVAQANADRLSKELLGFSEIDVKKYLGDRGLDNEAMRDDITKQLQQRGMSLQEAQFKADEFARAFDRSFNVNRADQADREFMADLSLRADQGDVQAGLQHADLMLKQAVANGELDQNAANTMLNDLFRYWNNPQEFALRWRDLKDRYDLQRRNLHQQNQAMKKKGGLFNSGIDLGLNWSAKDGFNVSVGSAG